MMSAKIILSGLLAVLLAGCGKHEEEEASAPKAPHHHSARVREAV